MRHFLHFLMASIPAWLCCAGPALAAPATVTVRENGAVTELLINSDVRRPQRFLRDGCGATLSLPVKDGLDISQLGGAVGRIQTIALMNPHTLAIATECGAEIGLARRDGQMVVTVAAPVVPARKPGTGQPVPVVADAALATASPVPLVPPPPVAGPESASAPGPAVAPGPAPAPKPVAEPLAPPPKPASVAQAERDAAYARDAVADGLRRAAEPPVPEKGSRDPRRPDPQWGTGPALVDLAAWRTGPYRAERDRLRKALAAEKPGPDAMRDLLRFHLAWDMAAEVLTTLDSLPRDQQDQALLAVSITLADPTDTRADWLLTNQALRSADGPLWAAVLLQRRGQGRDAVRYLPAASRALPSLPLDMRHAVGLDLLALAAGVGLDAMARTIARDLETGDATPRMLARLYYEIGRLHAAGGRQTLALAQWDKAAAGHGEVAAEARIAAASTRLERGEATIADLRHVLEQAVRDWPATSVEADSLMRLARLSADEGDVTGALEKLRLLDLRFHDRTPADAAALADMAVDLLGRLSDPERTPGITIADRMTSYGRGRDLLPKEPAGWNVRRQFAAMLADLGAGGAAEMELRTLGEEVPEGERPAILHDLVEMQLATGDAAAALATLDAMGADPAKGPRRGTLLRARALVMAGDAAGALKLAGDGSDAETLAVKAAAFWQQERWSDAVDAYRTLSGQGALSADDAARYSLAGLLADDPAAPRTLDSQTKAMADQPWAADLHQLARPVPGDGAGERDLRGLLEDADQVRRMMQPRAGN
ncbi:hypothetical protein [Niveispirillum irakense]|uniref:hypothetical protein n=1 Tax=Niveispirillum irakense TaxID=34011 RepID=UPI0004287531|nr:hypothetical protein [Niveispirillum irakense]